MILLFVLLAELILLFLLSRRLTHQLHSLFFIIFRSKTIATTLLTLILFPGTVVHELSHLFVAEILGVRTGKLTLSPEALEEKDGTLRTGSVAIAQTDPFRRYIIGLAPLFIGLIVLTAMAYWAPTVIASLQQSFHWDTLLSNPNLYVLLFGFYGLFAVSNSMFSSSEDLKGFVPFAITIVLICAAAFISGIRITLTVKSLDIVIVLLSSFVRNLGLVLAVNIVLLLVSWFLIVLAGKITRTHIVSGQ